MRGDFDVSSLQSKLLALNEQLNDPNIWQKDNFLCLQKERKTIEDKLNNFKVLTEENKYLLELCSILNSNEIDNTVFSSVTLLFNRANSFKQIVFFNKEDNSNCYIEIFCGSGGSDAQDFTKMILNMYIKYCNKNNFICNLLDITNTEFGIKNATLQVIANNAYGFLKNEAGVHRLVRMSDFNADNKRHTSFCAVNVYVELDDNEISLLDKDIKFDTFRAQGAGGQHVNTTDSAVRATYIPLNISVVSQSDRSQHKNKALAIKLLKTKVGNFYKHQKNAEKYKSYSNKHEIDFGNQIRSYILHPYLMVKDYRINYSSSNVYDVLAGDLNNLIMLLLTK